jgi:hypothetical protein
MGIMGLLQPVGHAGKNFRQQMVCSFFSFAFPTLSGRFDMLEWTSEQRI